MAKKTMYSFAVKTHSTEGKISAIMGAVSLVLLLAAVYSSYYMRGSAGVYAGAMGISGMIFSFAGFCMGIHSFMEKDIKYKYPKIGSIMSGIVFVVWLGLFVMGV